MYKQAFALALTAGVFVGCVRADREIKVRFPDPQSASHAGLLAVTAFEPIINNPETGIQFVTCDMVSVFPPDQFVNPEQISTVPNLGEVLRSRVNQPRPLGTWNVDISPPSDDNPSNPWGVVMVYIEARGDVRSSDESAGGKVQATLLDGCYCFRSKDGSYNDDPDLDREVKTTCPLLNDDEKETERIIDLQPVVSEAFQISTCGIDTLAGPPGAILSPGPSGCMETERCDNSSQQANCFRCRDETCNELTDKQNAPVLFIADSDNVTPETQVVLTDKDGRAEAEFVISDCSKPINVSAHIVGRPSELKEYTVFCVAPTVGAFECQPEVRLAGGTGFSPKDMTVIPKMAGTNEHLAVLYQSTTETKVVITNPAQGRELVFDRTTHPEFGEGPGIGIFSFYLNELDQTEPVVAVATTTASDQMHLYVYRWDGENLLGDAAESLVRAECTNWFCGSRRTCNTDVDCALSCIPDPDPERPSGCEVNGQFCETADDCFRICEIGDGETTGICKDSGHVCGSDADCPAEVCSPTYGVCMKVGEYKAGDICGSSSHAPAQCSCVISSTAQTKISMVARDLNNDGLADLSVASTVHRPITTFYANSGAGPLFRADDCLCGQYGQAWGAIEVANMVGSSADDRLDLVLGAPGGAFVRIGEEFAQGRTLLECGQPIGFGELVPVRDIVRGNFQCDKTQGCTHEDVVVVAADMLTGGSFDDPGSIRVVFGDEYGLTDLGTGFLLRDGTNVELLARTFEGNLEPRDPRNAAVGDFNGDNHDDLAVHYGSSGEIHFWLGSGERGLGELSSGIELSGCGGDTENQCAALTKFVTADLDNDGRSEVALMCDGDGFPANLRWYRPRL